MDAWGEVAAPQHLSNEPRNEVESDGNSGWAVVAADLAEAGDVVLCESDDDWATVAAPAPTSAPPRTPCGSSLSLDEVARMANATNRVAQRRRRGRRSPMLEAVVADVASGSASGAAALGDLSVASARVELAVDVRAGGEQHAGGDEAAARGEIVAAVVPDVGYDDPWLPMAGYSRLATLVPQLLSVMDAASRGDAVIDDDVVRLCESAASTEGRTTSWVALAETLSISGKKAKVVTHRVCATIALRAEALRRRLEAILASEDSSATCVFYNDNSRYDETPMRSRVREAFTQLPSQLRRADSAAATLGVRDSAVVKVSSVGAVAKIFQTEQSCGMVLKCGAEFVTVVIHGMTLLQALESTKSRVVVAALMQRSAVSQAARAFPFRVRSSCSDKASNNKLAERIIARTRSGWSHNHNDCDVHIVSTCYGKCFEVSFATEIQGLLHTAMSVRHGTYMTKLRQALYEEVYETLDMRYGEPPLDAIRYRKRMIDTFFARGADSARARVLLTMIPNGDWRKGDVVEVYFPIATQDAPSRPHVATVAAQALVSAFLHKRLELYPRRRWTGADLALDQAAGMEACHGLMSRAYRRFLASFAGSGVGGAASAGGDRAPVLPLADAAEEGEQQHEAFGEQPVPPEDAALAGARDCLGPRDGETWAEANARNRRVARALWQSAPLGRLLSLRVCMEPLRVLMAAMFTHTSEAWELEQRARVAAALRDGADPWLARSYLAVLAAEGVEEKACLAQLKTLLTGPEPWGDAFLEDDKTVATRCLLFKVLSRAGCAVEQLLALPHRGYPWAMFRALKDPAFADEVARVPDCGGGFVDPFTRDLRSRFPTAEALRSGECIAILQCNALLRCRDIAPLEARHAAVRRDLIGRSVQTHVREFRDTGAAWVLRACRQSRKRAPTTTRATKAASKARASVGGGGSNGEWSGHRRGNGGAGGWGRAGKGVSGVGRSEPRRERAAGADDKSGCWSWLCAAGSDGVVAPVAPTSRRRWLSGRSVRRCR